MPVRKNQNVSRVDMLMLMFFNLILCILRSFFISILICIELSTIYIKKIYMLEAIILSVNRARWFSSEAHTSVFVFYVLLMVNCLGGSSGECILSLELTWVYETEMK